jgi:hypothetical protein
VPDSKFTSITTPAGHELSNKIITYTYTSAVTTNVAIVQNPTSDYYSIIWCEFIGIY